MSILEQIQHSFTSYLQSVDSTIPPTIGILDINTDENKQAFGDLTTNAALLLAQPLKRSPRDIAQQIATHFSHEYIHKIDVAGPGFINIFLTQHAVQLLAQELYTTKTAYFTLPATTPKHTFSLEFVSANPTGPLHLGNGRGGIIGDVLGNILKFLGHHVTKEFYINDAGNQVKQLGLSFKARYLQLCGVDAAVPHDGYHGEYLIKLAQDCVAEHGSQLLDQPNTFFEQYAKTKILNQIKDTLTKYGITYDVWFSEQTLHDSGAIDQALGYLDAKGYLYVHDNALWFRSTQFGDDKDRVVRKSSGEFTYVAADIAYLKNKIDRGADHLLLVLGHDHHSFAIRLHSVLRALDLGMYPLDIILYQLVKVKEQGQQIRLSKRAGNIVDLNDIIETVGTDIARFFYLNRKADAQLEFDLDLALTKTEENPVYYIQYAYVRTKSIADNAAQITALQSITSADVTNLGIEEALLIKKIASLKHILINISTTYHTHVLAYYTYELAQLFSKYYAQHRIIEQNNVARSRARLLLVHTVRTTLGLCLELMGLSKPEHM